MKCAACHGGMPPGKIIFCPTCFLSLPRKEQRALASHYIRVANAAGKPIPADHPGMRNLVARLSKIIRTARGLTEGQTPAPAAGTPLVDADPRTETMVQFKEGSTP